jgi:hypothetical protein
MQVVANRPHHHCPGVKAHAHAQLQTLGATHHLGILAHGGLHGQGRIAGTQGMVLVGNGGAKEGHNAVAEHLVDGTLEAVHSVHHVVEGGIEELLGGFGIEAPDKLRRVLEVGKEHGDLLALAFQGTAGRQDLLGEIGGRVGERGRGLHGLGGGSRRGLTCPDQHGALLLNGTLVHLNDFHLQVVEVRVIEVELALERPVRDAASLAEQREHLIQHSVKVHERPSTCLPGSAQTASDLWGPCLRSQALARHATQQRQDSEKHTMTGAKAYQKRYAKARQRCRRTAAACLQRDHRQAQHVVKVLERALHDLSLPENLVAEIEGRLRSQQQLLGKIMASCSSW